MRLISWTLRSGSEHLTLRNDEATNSKGNFKKFFISVVSVTKPLHMCWKILHCFFDNFYIELHSVDSNEAMKR
jgi:hypothetical protein